MQDKPATRIVAELAARQHGVVSAGQLEGLGWGRGKVAREAAAGRLHRLHRGVYAVGHEALTQQGRALAAVLSGGSDALLSHLSAAWLWGISSRLPPVPEVTATITVRHARPDIRVHSASTLLASDRTVAEGIPVTAVPRMLLDVAGAAEGNVRWALPRAKRLGLLDLIEIDSMLKRSGGLRGVARLRVALDRYRIRAFTRSDLERDFLRLVARAGLPPPSTNLFIAGYELDAYWSDLRFAVELDTYDYHGDEISFEDDRLRQEDLKLVGIEMLRITGQRMDREPAAVASRLRRLLEQRPRELLPPR
ncbi:MAG: type IV toxin-antitoxin system AbiEi family antitoxin domain-containing protein [Solirubrobacterales bacterium]